MSKNFAQGMLVGTLVGGLAGAGLAFFLSPRTGKENREMVTDKFNDLKDRFIDLKEDLTDTVMEIFGEVSEATISLYEDASTLFTKQVAAFNQNLAEIDKDKYLDMIDNVAATLSKNKRNNTKDIDKLKRYWVRNWRQARNLLG